MADKHFFDLQLFADGGADGEGTAAAVSSSGLSGDFNADFGKYVLGKEDAAPAKTTEVISSDDVKTADSHSDDTTDGADTSAQDNTADIDAEFEELIKGRYKEQFGKRTQNIINQRFRAAKNTQENLESLQSAIAPLFDKYDIKTDDFQALKDAILNDESTFARKAMSVNKSTEEYKADFEAKQKQDAQAQADAMASMKETYAKWKAEEAELQKIYPNFKLAKAISENAEFKAAIENGTSLATAYKGAFFDDIAAGLVSAASQKATEKTVKSIASNAARPREGGVNATGGTTQKIDVNSLSEKQILDIIERSARGERISF